MGAYLSVLLDRRDPRTHQPLAAATLRRYLDAAYLYLRQIVDCSFTIYDETGPTKKLLPGLDDIIKTRKKWQQPQEKREPFTLRMFQVMFQILQLLCVADPKAALGLFASVFDWVCLGIFTGCRACEYAQTIAPRGEFSKVPDNRAAGTWAGAPIAFMVSDFTFYDHDMCLLSLDEVLAKPSRVFELHILFRFDKSQRNFVIKKYRRGQSYLCPIVAAISILSRARVLGVSPREPVGVFLYPKSPKGYTFLQSGDVIKVMRQVCVAAYPNPKHYYRIHIRQFGSHSNRVTAAVVLRAMGLDHDAIAARLRWHVASVVHYVRECDHMIEAFTHAAFQGIHCI